MALAAPSMMLALSLSAGAVVRPAVSGRVTRGARTPVRAIRVAAGATRVSTVAKLTTETESSSFQMPEFKAEVSQPPALFRWSMQHCGIAAGARW